MEPIAPYRLIVLGAGFSVAAKLPLARELSTLVLDRTGAAKELHALFKDVDSYREYERLRTGTAPNIEEIDIERLLSFLDIEHYLELAGSDTWSDAGNKGQLAARSVLAQVLVQRQQAMTEQDWQPYLRFAEALEPGDEVITFNYDTILETACERVGKPFRLCPHRYKTVTHTGGTLDSDRKEVCIRKVHGSVDWFDMGPYFEQARAYEEDPQNRARPYTNAAIVRRRHELSLEWLTEDPYPENEYLSQIVRVRKPELLLTDSGMWPVPFLVSPSAAKLVYLKPLASLWNGFNNAGWLQSQMIVIGFSFSSFDDYVLVPLIRAINNFQNSREKWDFYRPTKLKIVDFQANEAERRAFCDRVKWVRWGDTAAFWSGFSASIVPLLLEPNTYIERSSRAPTAGE
jgi:hypothetical protein